MRHLLSECRFVVGLGGGVDVILLNFHRYDFLRSGESLGVCEGVDEGVELSRNCWWAVHLIPILRIMKFTRTEVNFFEAVEGTVGVRIIFLIIFNNIEIKRRRLHKQIILLLFWLRVAVFLAVVDDENVVVIVVLIPQLKRLPDIVRILNLLDDFVEIELLVRRGLGGGGRVGYLV